MNSQSPLTTTELIAEGVRCYLPNYQPREIILDHGKGSRLWDRDGKEYIDLGAGIAVNSLGHANPDLLAALQSQAEKLWHTTNIYYTEPAILLAQELVEATFADQVFFCNSGAEANEGGPVQALLQNNERSSLSAAHSTGAPWPQ
jgi:acetylornithine/N-succinyldiaminopimelate aminotransferase